MGRRMRQQSQLSFCAGYQKHPLYADIYYDNLLAAMDGYDSGCAQMNDVVAAMLVVDCFSKTRKELLVTSLTIEAIVIAPDGYLEI